MTLLDLFKQYGITRPAHLTQILGCDRRYASAIWTGRRRIGRDIALRLHQAKGIPLEALFTAELPPRPPRREARER